MRAQLRARFASFISNDVDEKSIDKTGNSFLRRHHLLVEEKIDSMLYLEEYHRYRQDYLSQDRRHQLLADHPLLICSDQYAERCSPRARSTSVSDTLDRHYQALFFLVKMSSLNRVSESESADIIVVIRKQTREREREGKKK